VVQGAGPRDGRRRGPTGLTPIEPLGPTELTVGPQPVMGGRSVTFTLMAPGWVPPAEQVTQSYGLCFTAEGLVLLVSEADGHWSLPGGTVEAGETTQETLVREIAEEACARVVTSEYLACQHVWDPDHPEGRVSYYQTRWWAKVVLDPWAPEFETVARQLVDPGAVLETISWSDTTILGRLLAQAIEVEPSHR